MKNDYDINERREFVRRWERRKDTNLPVTDLTSFAGKFQLRADFVRPVLREANVSHVIRCDGLCYPANPRYQRKWSPLVSVTAESDCFEISQGHRLTWDYLVEHAGSVDAQLRQKLWEICHRNFNQFMDEIELDDPECEWDAIQNVVDWNSSASLDFQVYLFNITLLENSTSGVGFAVYNFDVGWDDEHGLCIAMQGDHVASVGGLGDYRI